MALSFLPKDSDTGRQSDPVNTPGIAWYRGRESATTGRCLWRFPHSTDRLRGWTYRRTIRSRVRRPVYIHPCPCPTAFPHPQPPWQALLSYSIREAGGPRQHPAGKRPDLRTVCMSLVLEQPRATRRPGACRLGGAVLSGGRCTVFGEGSQRQRTIARCGWE